MSSTLSAKARRGKSNRQEGSAAAATRPGPPRDGVPFELVPGTAADHHAVHQVLSTVFRRPSPDAFAVSLDHPAYEPPQRLLVRWGERIVAHLLASPREMHYGQLVLPVGEISWLATLPEFRGQGLARRLLAAAETEMTADGAMMGLMLTDNPGFAERAGWVRCGRRMRCRANTRELLAQLAGCELPGRPARTIRPWRQVELMALVRLYQENAASINGAYRREEATWRWLITRSAFDQIFVAIDGPSRLELTDYSQRIAGYVIIKEDRVVELMVDPRRPVVAVQLLKRACSEAIEQDHHQISVAAPRGAPLRSLLPPAAAGGEVLLARLPDPIVFLRRVRGELHRRAEVADLARPAELGILLDDEQKLRLVLSRRSVKVARGGLGRSYLRCDVPQLTRLLLGAAHVERDIEAGRLEASTRVAQDIAAALFPVQPLWRPPLDDLDE